MARSTAFALAAVFLALAFSTQVAGSRGLATRKLHQETTTVTDYNGLKGAIDSKSPSIVIDGSFTIEETLTISHEVTISTNTGATLGCPPALNSAFVIEGAAVTLISLKWKGCLLNHPFGAILAQNGASLTMQGLDVQDISNVAAAGFIYATDSTVSIMGSTFVNNRGYDGAILFAQKCTVSAKDSTFVNNKAYDDGVALWIEDSEASVTNCEFKDIQSDFSGGSIFSKGGSLKVVGTSFTNNKASYGGGIRGENSQIEVVDTTFVNNEAAYYAGAIYTLSGKLTISGSTFEKNKVFNFAGAIYSEGTDVIVTNSRFDSNVAEEYAGALYTLRGSLSLEGCTFENNEASYFTGAVYALDTTGVDVTRCTFRNNKGIYFAGALYMQFGTMNVKDSEFIGNSAKEFTGAIYMQDGTLNLEGSTMEGNSAEYYAGGVYVQNGAVNVKNSVFTKNTATDMSDASDGAIVVKNAQATYDNVNFGENAPVNPTNRGM